MFLRSNKKDLKKKKKKKEILFYDLYEMIEISFVDASEGKRIYFQVQTFLKIHCCSLFRGSHVRR